MNKSLLILLFLFSTVYLSARNNDIYEISSAGELKQFAAEVNGGNSFEGITIVLTSDITWNSDVNKNWDPIGNKPTTPFKGIFDGNGYTINTLYHHYKESNSTDYSMNYFGFFGFVENSTLKNIILNSPDFTLRVTTPDAQGSKNTYGSLLVGYAVNSLIFNNLISKPNLSLASSFGSPKYNHSRVIYSFAENCISTNNFYYNRYSFTLDSAVSEGHQNHHGQEIKTYTIETNSDGYYLLDNLSTNVNIDASFAGSLYCINSSCGKLTLGPETTQIGKINTQSLEMHDGCVISDLGIDNSGEIIYHRNLQAFADRYYQGGWETICLPFDAVLYADEEEKHPVLQDKSGKYWLRQYLPESNSTVEVSFASLDTESYEGKISSNIPYIIALPGDSYNSLSMTQSNITFRGSGAILPFENNPKITGTSPFVFTGNMHRMTSPEEERFMLNTNADCVGEIEDYNPGNFEEGYKPGYSFLKTKNTVEPFRAYFHSKATNTRLPEVLKIIESQSPTDIEPTLVHESDLTIEYINGLIFIRGPKRISTGIYAATTGRLFQILEISPEPIQIENLPNGVYLIGKHKIII